MNAPFPEPRTADAASAVVIPMKLGPIGRAALALAARGLRVFPCTRIGKKPTISGGLNSATTDPAQITEWWTRWPDAMIGVRTGPESGLWALDLDLDPGKGLDGAKALAELEAKHGPLPLTIRSRTPRGGMHYLFKWADGVRNSAGKVGPGIDVRGAGGYVIVPPSLRQDGAAYTWQDPPGLFDLADAPEWLLETVRRRTEPEPMFRPGTFAEPSRYAEVALAEECAAVVRAPNGSRNDALNRAAFSVGQLVAGGALDEGRVRARLAEAGLGAGLDKDEIARTIDSGMKGGEHHPRAPAQTELSSRREQGGRALPVWEAAPKPKPSGAFRLTLFRDIDPTPRKDWLVDDMLGEGELSVVYGVPGSAKSVLVGDAACHVAAGLPWLGKPVRSGAVLYVAAERAALVKRRMAAWKQRHGIDDLPLAVVDGVFNLSTSSEDLEQLVETIADLKDMAGQVVTWIIVDTKAQVMGGGDENAARDMMGFVANLARLQSGAEHAQGWRPHVTVVDHVPHAEPHRIRGHGALLGAADSTFRVTKEGTLRFIEADKANDAPDDVRLAFTLESVTLSVDAETGKETTAPLVVAADASVTSVTKRHGDGQARGPKLSGQMRKAAEIITLAIGEAGEAAPPHVAERAPPGARTVSKSLLDSYFTTAGLVDRDNKAAARTLWWRVRSELVGPFVDSWADHFWLKARASPNVTSRLLKKAPARL